MLTTLFFTVLVNFNDRAVPPLIYKRGNVQTNASDMTPTKNSYTSLDLGCSGLFSDGFLTPVSLKTT